MRRREVELHIEKLVLEGLPHTDRHRIARAVEQELARLIAEGVFPQSIARSGEVSNIEGQSFKAEQGSSVEKIGSKVARGIYGGLKR